MASAGVVDHRSAASRSRLLVPKLSKLDDKLDAEYRADLSELHEIGAAAIRSEQRAWLKAVGLVCRAPPHLSGRDCLRQFYAQRVGTLRDAVIKVGNTTIYYLDPVSPGQVGYFHDILFVETYMVRYPQIDRPDAAGLAWNRVVARVPDPNLACQGQSRLEPLYLVTILELDPGLIRTLTHSTRFVCSPDGGEPDLDDQEFVTDTVLRPSPH